GAEAFTVGEHIFLNKASLGSGGNDRELLAHEVIHTVQQTSETASTETLRADQVQRRIEHSTLELDPKVEQLIEGHFQHRRNQRAYTEAFEEAAAILRDPDGWWRQWRNSLEQIPSGVTETPMVTEAKVDE